MHFLAGSPGPEGRPGGELRGVAEPFCPSVQLVRVFGWVYGCRMLTPGNTLRRPGCKRMLNGASEASNYGSFVVKEMKRR